MTKSEFIYVIVRLVGVVLVGHAILTFISGLLMVSMPNVPRSMTFPLLSDPLVRASLEIVAGLYLIISGRLLYSILNREK